MSMDFNPDDYTITIKRVVVDGEAEYIGSVSEFPNIVAYEDSQSEALDIIREAIKTLQEIAAENGETLPAPLPIENINYSGRITLRIPKTMHAKIDKLSHQEGVSINQYLVSAIASYTGEHDGFEKAKSVISEVIMEATKQALFLFKTITLGQGTKSLAEVEIDRRYLAERIPQPVSFVIP